VPRLTFLSDLEQQEFDYPPLLSIEARAICFSISDELSKKINHLHRSTNKVGFLLQYAYFKACKRFFMINRFRQEDVEYASKVLGIPCAEVNINRYEGKTPLHHQTMILEMLNYKPFAKEQKQWVEKEITHRVERVFEPKKLFFEILHLLHAHHIEIPSYHCLADLITKHYINYENSLLTKVKTALTNEQITSLDNLLAISKNGTSGMLNRYKFIGQSTQPKGIQASLNIFNQIEKLVKPLLPIIQELSLTTQCCQYYATWVKKAKLSQLKQFSDENKMHVRLIAFLQHQYYTRQDVFVDILLKYVQSTKNTATHRLTESDQLSRSERRSAVRHLTKTHRMYRSLIDEITAVTQSSLLTDSGKIARISELLEQHRQEENDKAKKKKDHPLYKAIKEFGRVIKSLFILTYFDDVKLRQRIEKQLNRIESSNKFAKAVFYANNSEFKQADPEEQNIARRV
jgi:hypothetical protein